MNLPKSAEDLFVEGDPRLEKLANMMTAEQRQKISERMRAAHARKKAAGIPWKGEMPPERTKPAVREPWTARQQLTVSLTDKAIRAALDIIREDLETTVPGLN